MLRKKIDAVLAQSPEVVITTMFGVHTCTPLADRDRYVTRDGWGASRTLEPRDVLKIRPPSATRLRQLGRLSLSMRQAGRVRSGIGH